MKTLVQRFKQLHNDEAGQGLVEYIMLIALVIAAAAACFPGLSAALVDAFDKIGIKLGTVRELKVRNGGQAPRLCSARTFRLLRLARAGQTQPKL